MNETVIARATKTTRAPRDYGNAYGFTIKAEAYLLGGNQHPHFAVTGDIYHEATKSRNGDGTSACGCLHDEALKAWPAIEPIIRLHGSNADDGEPTHAVANGFYDLAGAVDHHFGEQYHRGNSEMNFTVEAPPDEPWKNYEHRLPTQDECLKMCADHLRVSIEAVATVRDECCKAWDAAISKPFVVDHFLVAHDQQKARVKEANAAAKAVFALFVDTLRDQWKREAEEGIALIRRLATKQEEVAA